MAFVNEIPTEQDIEKYNLSAFVSDKDKPLKWRGVWTVDRERDFHLWGGLSGDQAHDDEVLGKFNFYLAGLEFLVSLEPGNNTGPFVEKPFFVRWKALRSICSIRRDLDRQIEMPKAIGSTPDEPQEFFGNRSLNDFISLLKEGLIEHKKGYFNQFISGPMIIEFEF